MEAPPAFEGRETTVFIDTTFSLHLIWVLVCFSPEICVGPTSKGKLLKVLYEKKKNDLVGNFQLVKIP